MNKEGAIAGMIVGITLTASYIIYFSLYVDNPDGWWFGISPEGIGTLGMIANIVVSLIVCHFTPPPPAAVQRIVENIRIPRGAGEAQDH